VEVMPVPELAKILLQPLALANGEVSGNLWQNRGARRVRL